MEQFDQYTDEQLEAVSDFCDYLNANNATYHDAHKEFRKMIGVDEEEYQKVLKQTLDQNG